MRVKVLLIPIVASVALLTACTPAAPAADPTPTTNGIESLSAEEILERAGEALEEADSYTLTGSVEFAEAVTLGLELTYAGNDIQGTVDFLGAEINVIKVGGTLYINADPTFWISAIKDFLPAVTADQLEALGDRLSDGWASAPAALAGPFVPIPLSVDDILGEDAVAAPLTKGEPTTLGGEPVIVVTDADGATFTVALTGEPYLLEIGSPEGGEPIVFSDFGKEVDIEAPADAFDLLTVLSAG